MPCLLLAVFVDSETSLPVGTHGWLLKLEHHKCNQLPMNFLCSMPTVHCKKLKKRQQLEVCLRVGAVADVMLNWRQQKG